MHDGPVVVIVFLYGTHANPNFAGSIAAVKWWLYLATMAAMTESAINDASMSVSGGISKRQKAIVSWGLWLIWFGVN